MDKIADYCENFAKSHRLRVIRDAANNVVIFKDATSGYENAKPIILQGHLDMVWQKDEDCTIDFEKDVIEKIRRARFNGFTHYMIVVAEGAGSANEIAAKIKEAIDLDPRVTVLGHIQRGGVPTGRDRVNATKMGYLAVELLMAGKTNRIVCTNEGSFVDVDIEVLLTHTRCSHLHFVLFLGLHHIDGRSRIIGFHNPIGIKKVTEYAGQPTLSGITFHRHHTHFSSFI